VKDNRPRNIDLNSLMAYAFPLPAITSILHRISGIAVFLMIPLLLCLVDLSLSSEQGFARMQEMLESWVVKLFFWLTLSGLAYHLFAGIKHLIMDFGFAETLPSSRLASQLVLVISALAAFLLGVWVW